MIVGTAGHIDHGKTTLVRALTGVDTDRLPEEKRRGISIELGFAYLDVPATGAAQPAARLGFVDVPGHERLVHTMLAGATGIDFALLLVAADDGVMPQTREHLAVLSLLGLSRGAVAVTKVDRVDADRVAAVCAETAGLLAATPLHGAPVLAVSAQTGEGLDALRRLLFDAARAADDAAAAPPDHAAAFRLAVDRAFTLGGIGTVATGTVHAGRVRIGDELALAPSSPGDGLRVRVRSLHAQNRAVDEAHAGQRCAVGLAGVARERIGRGDWLVAPAVALSTQRLDATLTVWHAEARPLRSGTPVHVHVGAASVLGTVAVLAAAPDRAAAVAGSAGGAWPAGAGPAVAAPAGAGPATPGNGRTATALGRSPADVDALAPGRRAHVQIVLRQPIAAWHGDRIVLRDAAASRTLAGGVVLDPFAPARYRRTPQRLAELAAWSLPTAPARLAALVAAAPHGVSLGNWAVAQALEPAVVASDGRRSTAWPLPAGAVLATDAAHGDWAVDAAAQSTVRDAALTALREFHDAQPDSVGPSAGQLRRRAAPRLPEPLWRALLARWQAAGDLAVRGAFVQLTDHAARLSATDARLARQIAPLLAQAGNDGAWARDLARGAGESETLVRVTLARLAQRGEVHQVVRDLYYPPQRIARLAELARQATTAGGGGVTAAAYRDAAGLGRKRAIQLLEYFDRIGLLRRVGDEHRWRGDAGGLAGAATPPVDAADRPAAAATTTDTEMGGGTSPVGRPGFKPGG